MYTAFNSIALAVIKKNNYVEGHGSPASTVTLQSSLHLLPIT